MFKLQYPEFACFEYVSTADTSDSKNVWRSILTLSLSLCMMICITSEINKQNVRLSKNQLTLFTPTGRSLLGGIARRILANRARSAISVHLMSFLSQITLQSIRWFPNSEMQQLTLFSFTGPSLPVAVDKKQKVEHYRTTTWYTFLRTPIGFNVRDSHLTLDKSHVRGVTCYLLHVGFQSLAFEYENSLISQQKCLLLYVISKSFWLFMCIYIEWKVFSLTPVSSITQNPTFRFSDYI